jgi:hypothetical protein
VALKNEPFQKFLLLDPDAREQHQRPQGHHRVLLLLLLERLGYRAVDP